MLAVSVALAMLEWIRTSYFSPSAANLWPVSSACSRPGSRDTAIITKDLFVRCDTEMGGKLWLEQQAREEVLSPTQRGWSAVWFPIHVGKTTRPSGVRILSLSLFPLRLYWECLMRRMLRVALGLPLSCSELGSSVALSFFFPLDSKAGSLLNTVKTQWFSD